nr:MAG TPA: hypothetical protein [Caudoviricetes sp.]
MIYNFKILITNSIYLPVLLLYSFFHISSF